MTKRLIITLGSLLALGCGAPAAQDFFYSHGKVHNFSYEKQQIRFDSGATARLTQQIVVGIADANGPAEIAAQPGFLAGQISSFNPKVYLATFANAELALAAANTLYGRPGVRWAHPDFALNIEARTGFEPSDEPLAAQAWHLAKTQTPTAWRYTHGQASTLVAVIDLGFEQNHSDLQAAWYKNPGEIPNNRLDDDGNGLVDDQSGWNFAVNGNNLIYGMNAAHGTATAGIVGARANGQGTVGICPECTLLPLVVDEQASNAAAAFYYAARAGAAVISNSWGYAIGTPTTDVLVEAIKDVSQLGREGRGATIIFAMDNRNHDNCRGPEPDVSSLETVIAVSAVDANDRKIATSGYGDCLDLVAPSAGRAKAGIVTTDRPGNKGFNRGDNREDFADLAYTNTFYGTSAAAPQVAGGFALLYAANPDLTPSQARERILQSADKVSPKEADYNPNTGVSRLYGYGRINIGRALQDQHMADQ